MSSNSNGKSMPDKDPYHVLGISFEASDAEINKAYRKLALKLHPDKQQNVSDSQRVKMAQDFHDVQQAKAFLSDPEFESARTKYKAKLASQRLRRAADEARNKTMSINRKRMREELEKQEAQASKSMGDNDQRQRARSKGANVDVDGLRKEGSNMREEFANKRAADMVKKYAETKAKTEDRQVRLKWSRKKIGVSPSDDSLAKLMQQFGKVERVEMLGSKGNSALITFIDESSAKPCVEFYKKSDEMRASYVGNRKEREDYKDGTTADDFKTATTGVNDRETVSDWKLRREAERENLLRQMEAEEVGSSLNSKQSAPAPTSTKPKISKSDFPPPFPVDEYDGLEPFKKLERYEEVLLGGLVSKETLARLKVVQGESASDAGDRTS